MPYIDKAKKAELLLRDPETAGELTYILTVSCQAFLGPDPHFQDFAETLGALEACKLELYRRAVAPYENEKIAENGDVY